MTSLVSAVAEADHEVHRAVEMVGNFLDRLCRDLRHSGVGRPCQLLKQKMMPGVEQELPHQRLAEITVRTLEQKDIAEFVRVTQVGQVVRRAALAFDLSGQVEPQPGLAEQ